MHSGLRFISWLSLVYLFFVLSSGKPEKISNCLHHFAATNFLLYFNSSNRITWHESYLNNESCHETFQKAIKKQKSKINKRIGTRTRDSEAQITFEAVACWQNLQPWPKKSRAKIFKILPHTPRLLSQIQSRTHVNKSVDKSPVCLSVCLSVCLDRL